MSCYICNVEGNSLRMSLNSYREGDRLAGDTTFIVGD